MLSMKKIMLVSALSLFATAAYAEDAAVKSDAKAVVKEDFTKIPADIKGADREALKAKWAAMSPEEKKAFYAKHKEERMKRRAEMKEKWDNATPEERAKMKEERQARKEAHHEMMKEKLKNATPEERAKMKEHHEIRKEKRVERRDKMKEHHDSK